MERTLMMSEYLDWISYYEAEPWGCRVEDHRFNVLIGTVVSGLGGDVPDGGFFPRSLDDVHSDRSKRRNTDALLAKMETLFGAHNIRQDEKRTRQLEHTAS